MRVESAIAVVMAGGPADGASLVLGHDAVLLRFGGRGADLLRSRLEAVAQGLGLRGVELLVDDLLFDARLAARDAGLHPLLEDVRLHGEYVAAVAVLASKGRNGDDGGQ